MNTYPKPDIKTAILWMVTTEDAGRDSFLTHSHFSSVCEALRSMGDGEKTCFVEDIVGWPENEHFYFTLYSIHEGDNGACFSVKRQESSLTVTFKEIKK